MGIDMLVKANVCRGAERACRQSLAGMLGDWPTGPIFFIHGSAQLCRKQHFYA
jgi:hypothetical protein